MKFRQGSRNYCGETRAINPSAISLSLSLYSITKVRPARDDVPKRRSRGRTRETPGGRRSGRFQVLLARSCGASSQNVTADVKAGKFRSRDTLAYDVCSLRSVATVLFRSFHSFSLLHLSSCRSRGRSNARGRFGPEVTRINSAQVFCLSAHASKIPSYQGHRISPECVGPREM